MADAQSPEGSHAPRTLTGDLAALAWRHRYLLIAAVAAMYFAGLNAQWRPSPDSAQYLLTARHLLEGRGFVMSDGSTPEFPPGVPSLVAAIAGPFGGIESATLALNLVFTLIALMCVGLVYLLVRATRSPGVALVCAGLVAVNKVLFELSLRVLTDLPFLLGLLMLLVGVAWFERVKGWARRSGLVALMAAGLSVMFATRTVALVVVVALGGCLVLRAITGPHRRRYALALLLVLAAGLGARAAFTDTGLMLNRDERLAVRRLTEAVHPTANPDTREHILTVNVPRVFEEHTPEILFAHELMPVADTAVALLVLGGGLLLLRRRPLWGMLVLTFMAQWILLGSFLRYYVVLLPILAYGYWRAAEAAEARLGPTWGRYAAAALVGLWVVPNLITSGGELIVQQRRPFLAHYRDGDYLGVPELGASVADTLPPDAWLLAPDSIADVLAFYADRPVGSADARHLHATKKAWPEERPLYVVLPLPESERAALAARRIKPGELVMTIPRPGDDRPWAVHHAGR